MTKTKIKRDQIQILLEMIIETTIQETIISDWNLNSVHSTTTIQIAVSSVLKIVYLILKVPPIVFLETDVLTWKETLSFFTPRTIFSEQPDIRLSPEESQPGKKTLKDGVCSRRKEVLKKVPELKAKEQRMRRGQKLIHKVKSLKIFLTNAAGLFSKLERITNKLKYFDAGIFKIQESHFTTKGKLKFF